MGRNLRLEYEHGNRVDHGRNGPGDEAALRLGTALLHLLLGLLLALLDLFLTCAGLTAVPGTADTKIAKISFPCMPPT